MKLLCVVPSYWPAFKYGGPISSVHGLNKTLVEKGVDVTVYTTNVGLERKVAVNQEVNVAGVKVFYFAFTKLFELFGRTGWQFSRQMTKALKRELKIFDLVYIVAIWNYPTAAAAYYCRRYRKPYLIALRGGLNPYAMGNNVWKKQLYYNLIIKSELKGAAAIHYTTNDELEKVHPFFGFKNRGIVIPNGIEFTEFDHLPEKERLKNCYPLLKNKKVILFLGRINWIKGMDILTRAYGKLAKERSDVHLLIVGNDEAGYQKKVRGWLKDEEALDKVTFIGMLTGEDKLKAYAGSDLFVLPSYSENFGMAIVEAMACKIPVIISDQVGIHKEVAESNAGLVIPCDTTALTQAMERLLDDTELCQTLGENAQRLVREEFTWDKVAERMIRAYQGILRH